MVASVAIFSLPPHEARKSNPKVAMKKILFNSQFFLMFKVPPLLKLSLQSMGVCLQHSTLLGSLTRGEKLI